MHKFLFAILPLAAMFMVAGCTDESQAGASRPASSVSAPAPAPAQAQAPAPQQQQYRRNSTTQPLPAGWGYIHEEDLVAGKAGAEPEAGKDS